MHRLAFWRIQVSVAVVLIGFLTACTNDSTEVTDGVDLATSSSAEATTTTQGTTTTSSEATTTTLSEEDVEYDEQVDLADRLMVPIEGYVNTRNQCFADPENCDREKLAGYLGGAIDPQRDYDLVDGLIADGKYKAGVEDPPLFVRYRIDSEDPLAAAVWVCMSYELAIYQSDSTNTTVRVDDGEPGYLLSIFQVVEQPDETLRLEQVVELEDENEEQPQGGTCEAYEKLPPAGS